jgi:membrane protease YdiL (CAAX protease family)
MSDVSAIAAPPQPPVARRSTLQHFRVYVDVAVVITVLVATNLLAHFTTAWANIVVVPVGALALVALMRTRGLGWTEIGLGRAHWRSGARYALTAALIVGSVIGIGIALPWTRPMFLNNRYATISGALLASMIIIPLQTVIPEELAFRGVLHGTLDRAWGFRGVATLGSVLFGFWHIATSLGLTSGNVGLTHILGTGFGAMLAGVVGAVIATGAAGFVFTWLRRRSGSLLAPIALHWSLNGMGALAAAAVWHFGT